MAQKSRISLSLISHHDLDDKSILALIAAAKKGISYAVFAKVVDEMSFSQREWAGFLNTTVRTLQRYQVEKKVFDLTKSERILQIAVLSRRGQELFGDIHRLHTRLNTDNVSLGHIKPNPC